MQKKQNTYPDRTKYERIYLQEQAMADLLKRINSKEPIQTFLEAVVIANITECEHQRQQQLDRQLNARNGIISESSQRLEEEKQHEMQSDPHFQAREKTLQQIMAPDTVYKWEMMPA